MKISSRNIERKNLKIHTRNTTYCQPAVAFFR